MTTGSLSWPLRPGCWESTFARFQDCHRHRLNVTIHLLTVHLGIWAFLGLLAKIDPSLAVTSVAATLLLLTRVLPPGLWWANAATTATLLVLNLGWPVAFPWLLIALVTAYGLQDFAHVLTAEPTFDLSYRDAAMPISERWTRWIEHCLLLSPLTLAAIPCARGSALAWLVPRKAVVHGAITSKAGLAALARLRQWIDRESPRTDTTTHWWPSTLDTETRAAFDQIVRSPEIEAMFRARHGGGARIRPVEAMNEIYVAGPDRAETSDGVFHLPHIDGPLAVFPGATLYRCMVAVGPNARVRTRFPMERNASREEAVILDESRVVAFDYHRTPHLIEAVEAVEAEAEAGPRINLKLHYVVSPSWLPGWADLLAELSAHYNERARRLFLDTLEPETPGDRLSARTVLLNTHVWQSVAARLGHRNLLYLALLCALSIACGTVWPLVVGGSFVHYLLYLAVYGSRRDVSFGVFKRDAIFYKTVSMAILGFLYLSHFEWSLFSILLIGLGFATAAAAARALGFDRTYFGAELGYCPSARIDRFPYGVIPHPMILGSIVGLIGVAASEPFRSAWPWLVPAHVAFYLCHLTQEVFDLHGEGGDQRPSDRPRSASSLPG